MWLAFLAAFSKSSLRILNLFCCIYCGNVEIRAVTYFKVCFLTVASSVRLPASLSCLYADDCKTSHEYSVGREV